MPKSILDEEMTYDDLVRISVSLLKRNSKRLVRIEKLEAALHKIANMDYGGNRSPEMQIAHEALKQE